MTLTANLWLRFWLPSKLRYQRSKRECTCGILSSDVLQHVCDGSRKKRSERSLGGSLTPVGGALPPDSLDGKKATRPLLEASGKCLLAVASAPMAGPSVCS